LVMLAYLRRQWSLSGRDGFETLSPSCRACETGFGTFCESKTPIFHCVGGEKTKAKGSHWGDQMLNQTLVRTWLACPVSSSREQRARAPARLVGHETGASSQAPEKLRSTRGRSDAVTHQVMIDRTRQVVSGCLLESTGRWHCGVRSVQAARPIAWLVTRISDDRTP
jgi:hypothetical protein